MTARFSNDLRRRVVGPIAPGESCRSAAAPFGIAVSSAVKWSQRYRATGSIAPGKMGGHRKRALEPHRVFIAKRTNTSALGPEFAGEVVEVLAQLVREGTTMLMATHDLRLAHTIAGNVVFLDRGEIVEAGPARKVFGAPAKQRTKQFISSLTAQTTA